LQKGGATDGLFEFQQPLKDNDPILHHLQEDQERGKLLYKLDIMLHQQCVDAPKMLHLNK
jgi:hypothetical protein